MERFKDLLRIDGVICGETKQELVKLIWLFGQVPETARQRARAKLRPLLARRDIDEPRFLRTVRDVSAKLEEVRQARALDPREIVGARTLAGMDAAMTLRRLS